MDDVAGQVMTVTGPVPPGSLGYTLAHEHLFIRMWDIDGRFDYAQLLDDEDVLAEELRLFQAQDGGCVVELTLPDIGRRPERLHALSVRSGVKVVMGAGWYREPYYRTADAIAQRTVDSLAAQITAEFVDGVGPERFVPVSSARSASRSAGSHR